MFRRRKACASEYKASLLAVVNERSQGSLKAVQSYGTALLSLFEEGQLYSFAVQFKLTSLIFGGVRHSTSKLVLCAHLHDLN